MLKVSFVVAIYNVSQYLPRCIESIINQRMDQVEIILVNDGSTDDCLAICNSYAARDHRIRVVNQENGGANAARNKGLQMAQGEWVYFVDGDDFVDPTVCTAVEQYLHGDCDIVMFAHALFKGGQVKAVPHSEGSIIMQGDDFKELQLSALNRLGNYRYHHKVLDAASLWNKMYCRAFLQENKISFITGFPKLQDISFNLMVYERAHKAVYVPNVGYYFRHNDQSVSHRYQKNLIDKFDVINRWFGQFIADKMGDERYMKAYRERIATHMRTCIVLCLCNRENEHSYRERRAKFLQLRAAEPYRSALDRTGIRAFHGYKERILAFAVKYRLFWLCELLCRMYDKIAA